MLSRRTQFRDVVAATRGSLGPGRPDNEVWHCKLSCGHMTWRSAVRAGEVFPRLAPKRLICDELDCRQESP